MHFPTSSSPQLKLAQDMHLEYISQDFFWTLLTLFGPCMTIYWPKALVGTLFERTNQAKIQNYSNFEHWKCSKGPFQVKVGEVWNTWQYIGSINVSTMLQPWEG